MSQEPVINEDINTPIDCQTKKSNYDILENYISSIATFDMGYQVLIKFAKQHDSSNRNIKIVTLPINYKTDCRMTLPIRHFRTTQ